jgi:glutaredoxin
VTRAGRNRLVAGLMLFCAALLVGGYLRFRSPDISSVMVHRAPLSGVTPVTMFVQPDLQHRPVSDRAYAVLGHYTIIVYHQRTCPDCQRLDRDLERLVRVRPDVAVRKIDLGERWSSAGARRDFGRNIGWTPYVVIYAADGRQISADDGPERHASRLLAAWIKVEAGRAAGGGTSG